MKDPIAFLFATALSIASNISVAHSQTVEVAAVINENSRSNVSFSDVLKVPFAEPDQRLVYGETPEQFVVKWQPTETQSTTPIIVTIHGGCWLNAYAIDHTYAMNSALRDAGFEVWSLEYRRVGDGGGGWPGSFTDIQQGLAHIIAANGGATALAKRDVTLMGHSAGGHLALLAAQQHTAIVDRVVGLAAIADLPTYARGDNSCQQAASSFMESADDTAWHAANPIANAPKVPSYLFHGDADTIVPQQQSTAYATFENVHLQWLEGAGHFDLIDPHSRAWLTIVTKLQQLSAKN